MRLTMLLASLTLVLSFVAPPKAIAQAPTEVEAKLARQRTIYERDLERLRKRIESQLESKKRSVQKSGTTTETDQLLAEIDAYESRGQIPDVRAADSIRRGYAKAAEAMTKAYNKAKLEPGGAELFTEEAEHFSSHWDLTPWRALPLPSPDEPVTLTPDQPIALPNDVSLPFRLEVTAEAIDDDASRAVEFQSAEGTRLAVRADPDDRGRFRVLLTVDEDFVAADLGLTRPIDRSHAYVSETTIIELFARDGAVRINSARIKPVIDGAPPRAQVAGKAGNRNKEPDPNPLPQGSEWTGTLFGESAGARVATVKVISSDDTSATLSVTDKHGTNHWLLQRQGANFVVTSVLPKKSRQGVHFKNVRGTGRVENGHLRWNGRWLWQGTGDAGVVDAYLDIKMK
ncbi:MAG: hypothetical protein ACIARR_01115 [Phycisphaerales bacterium JB059]